MQQLPGNAASACICNVWAWTWQGLPEPSTLGYDRHFWTMAGSTQLVSYYYWSGICTSLIAIYCPRLIGAAAELWKVFHRRDSAGFNLYRWGHPRRRLVYPAAGECPLPGNPLRWIFQSCPTPHLLLCSVKGFTGYTSNYTRWET